MATAYAQPAAANYFAAPSHPPPKQRGYRVCDQCGAVEQPTSARFRLCGGCMITQYCSQDCQKMHWPSHKQICQHTSKQVSAMKQPGDMDENLALQLKRLPSNVRQNALLIELSYHPSASESVRRFSIKGTHIVPRTYVTDNDPLVGADIQRREERCRRSGGIGTAVILIQCSDVSQVMPVEVDAPSKISWDYREDWADTLRHFVDSGRIDFKPISTTPRGIVYG